IIAQIAYVEDLKLRNAVFVERYRLNEVSADVAKAQAVQSHYELFAIQHGAGTDSLSLAARIAELELQFQRDKNKMTITEAVKLVNTIKDLQKLQLG
ncbi:unnamed protein product, partial [marine sediment metagenome]